jgi:hypothetical protein
VEGGLIQAERGHPVQPRGVVHQLGPVLSHRPHDGRPADPKVTGDRGDRVGILADPSAGLGPSSLGQHRPRPDRGRLFGPGPDPAGRLTTAPEAFAPPQHHRPAADRQIPHPDGATAVECGPHPTAPTAGHRARGLDRELPFATHELGRDELEAVQVEQPGARRTTVMTHLGLLLADVRHPQAMRGPRCRLGTYGAVNGTSPCFMTKSRLTKKEVRRIG